MCERGLNFGTDCFSFGRSSGIFTGGKFVTSVSATENQFLSPLWLFRWQFEWIGISATNLPRVTVPLICHAFWLVGRPMPSSGRSFMIEQLVPALTRWSGGRNINKVDCRDKYSNLQKIEKLIPKIKQSTDKQISADWHPHERACLWLISAGLVWTKLKGEGNVSSLFFRSCHLHHKIEMNWNKNRKLLLQRQCLRQYISSS